MIWILLLYVLPLVLSIIVLYIEVRMDNETIGDFIENSVWAFIPVFNIVLTAVGAVVLIEYWVNTSETLQNFLNKKL